MPQPVSILRPAVVWSHASNLPSMRSPSAYHFSQTRTIYPLPLPIPPPERIPTSLLHLHSSRSTRTFLPTNHLPSPPSHLSAFRARSRRQSPIRTLLRPFSNTLPSSLPVLAKLFEILSRPPSKAVPMPSSPTLCGFLERNEQFASTCDPDLLATSSKGQAPSVFWLGCSDSRVPEGVVIRAGVGEVFVHRNVANVFHPEDTSATAALAYAVNHLKVKHVVVVGHESCGGCAAALAAASAPPPSAPPVDVGEAAIARWIGPIKAVAESHLAKGPLDLSQLVAANVKTQVKNVIEHEVIMKAWARGQPISVHGWVYDLASGKVTDLGLSQSSPTV